MSSSDKKREVRRKGTIPENKPTKTQYGYGIKDSETFKIAQVSICAASMLGCAVFFCFFKETPERPADKPFSIKGLVSKAKDHLTGKNNTPGAIEDEPGRKLKKSKRIVRYYTGPQKLKRPLTDKIPPGSMIKARLITGASNGPVKVEVISGLEVAGSEIIPEGSHLLGEGQSGDDRLFIRFTHLMFEDGSFLKINAQAADKSDQVAGLKGSKMSGHMRKIAAATALNFAAGYSEGLKERQVQNGQVVDSPTAKNALLNGASSAALELSTQEFQKLKNKRPVIYVEKGKEILIIFAKN